MLTRAGTANPLAPLAATYTWNVSGGTASWATSTNWLPDRTTLAADDIILFSNGLTNTVTNVPTQFIGQLVVSAGTTVNLQAAGGITLNISGGGGIDLHVQAGSALNCNTTGGIGIAVNTGATATISGSMTLSAGSTTTHSFSANDAGAITFTSGSSFTQGPNINGNIFGGVSNSVIFESGSTFIQKSGATPFPTAVFQTGSLFSFQHNSLPSFSGRTYANLEINAASFNQTGAGAGALSIDDLTVTAGSLSMAMTGTFNLKGNVSVASGATLSFNAAPGTVTLNGTSAQTIGGAGTLQILSGTQTVSVSNSSGVTLQRNVATSGPFNVVSGGVLNCGTNIVSGNGTFNLQPGGTLGIGSTDGIRIGFGTPGNIQNLNRIFNSAANYIYNGASAQVTGNGLPTTLTGALTISNTAGVTLSQNTTLNGASSIGSGATLNTGAFALTLNNTLANGGTFNVSSGGTLKGTGTVTGPTTVASGGTVAPGVSPGIINTGNVSFTSGSVFQPEINGTTVGTQYDQLNVIGTVDLGGATLDVLLGFTPAAGNTFTIINNDDVDGVTGTFAGLAEGSTFTVSGTTFTISYVGGDGNDVVLTAGPSVQASNITFAGVQVNQMGVYWTNGDGTKRIVKMNTSNSFTNPVDGTDPAANSVYGGAGEQVVFNGTGSVVGVTGLSAGTTYWFRVYEYNGSGASTVFLTTSATNNPNSQATPPSLVSIAVTPPNPSIILPGTQQFTATGTFSDASSRPLVNAPATWSTKASMVASGRTDFAAATLLGRIYVAGGAQSVALASVEAYDPVANSWSTKASLPTTRTGGSAASVGNKMYVIGGNAPGSCGAGLDGATLEYDPSTDTWSARASMNTPRAEVGAVVINGLIYAAGGYNIVSCSSNGLPTLEVYDPVANTWTPKTSMPLTRVNTAAAALGGKLYVVGGYTIPVTARNDLQIYDPGTDSWTSGAPMPTARGDLSLIGVNGKLYAIGGYNGGSNVSTVEVYDPATNTWSTGPSMPAGRASISSAEVSGTVYTLGGCPPSFCFPAVATNEALALGEVSWSSSDATKATISLGGLATAVAFGTTTITATDGTVSGSTTLTVAPTKYRSRQNGNWNDFNTWEVSPDGTTWTPAASGQIPTSADDTIAIRDTHTVTVSASVAADQLIIEPGGILAISNSVTLTIDDGTGTDLAINRTSSSSYGTVNVASTGVVAGTGTISVTGELGIASTNATDALAANVTNPNLTLNAGSTVNFNGAAGQGIGARNYDNLTFSNNAKTLANAGTIGIAGTFTPGTSSSHTINFSTIEYNGASAQTLPSGFQTYENLRLNNIAGTTGFSGLKVNDTLTVQAGTFTSASDYHHVVINSGGTLSLTNPITVSGDWTNNGTFVHNGNSVTFDGTGAQTITTGGTGAGNSFAGFVVNKATDTATLAGDLRALTVTVTTGTFSQGSSFSVNTTAGGTVATVGTNGTWQNFGTGDLTLSGNITNNGTIEFNGNGTACNELATNDISIGSTGSARTWSGTGTFSMTDVTVVNQTAGTPPIAIFVNSGTNGGGNTGWTFVDQCTAGTYTWIGGTLGANTDWQVGTNWNPTRATPAAGDVLIFDGNSTPAPTVTNVPTQTISSLLFTNSVNPASLNASSVGAPHTLTITGNAGLNVASGSRLEVVGSNGLTIAVTTGSGSTINGQISLRGGPHRLTGQNAGQIVFSSTGLFAAGTISPASGFSGNPFGTGTTDSVRFQDGSSAFFNEGSDPFATAGGVVTFTSASNQEFNTSTAWSASGRSYGNLTLSGASQTYFDSGATIQVTVMGNLTIANGNTFKLSDQAGGDLNLWGSFTDNGTAATSFQANGRIVKFQGGSNTQTIFKAGFPGEIFSHVTINKIGGSVKLLSDIAINGNLVFDGTAGSAVDMLELNGETVSLSGSISAVPDTNSGFKGDVNGAGIFTGVGFNAGGNPFHFVSGGEFLTLFGVNNATGVSVDNDLTMGHPTTTPNGALTLTLGVLDMGTNTLTLNKNCALNRTSGYVSGNLKKVFDATGAFNFAVGTANGYSPVGVNVTAGTGELTVKAVQGAQPNITGANALQRYWTLNGTGITADLTFNYLDPTDIPGTANESAFVIFKYDGSFTTPGGTVDTGANTASISGVSSFSDWTLAEAAAVQEGSLAYFDGATSNVTEGNAGPTIKNVCVTRSGGTDGAVSVNYATSDGTAQDDNPATEDNDYVATSGTLNWADNESGDKCFNVTINGDTTFEPTETINITLSSPTGGVTLSQTGHIINVVNDEPCSFSSFTVNDNGDDPDALPGDGACATAGAVCTLRAAIQEANALTSCGTIDLDFSGVASPINLTSALPSLDHNVNINGPGAASQTVRRDTGGDYRIFNINGGRTVTITGLTISNGRLFANSGNNFGGGINNGGTLTLTNSVVSGNTVTGSGNLFPQNFGGGIYNGGTLTVSNCTLSGNSSAGSNGATNYGAGIYNASIATVINSTFSGNTISGDNSSNIGGGIYNNATLTITQGTFSGNTVSGNNTVNYGAGIANSSTGTLRITSSTVFGNFTSGTASNKNAGGILNLTGSVSVRNTVVAGNTGTDGDPDISGAFTSLSHNFIGTRGTGSSGFTNGVNNDQVGTNASPLDPQLGALANNGGPTQTMKPATGSLLIDAGTNVTTLNGAISDVTTTVILTDATSIPAGIVFLIQIDNEQMSVIAKASNTLTVVRGANGTTAAAHSNGAAVNPAFDQRGTGFPRNVDGNADSIATVDIGAYEAACEPATPTAGNGGPYCEGGTIQLSTSTVSGATYSWTGPNGFTSSDQNPTRANATTADAGTYSVTITVNGCTSAAGTTDVVVNATPATPTATNDGPICQGGIANLSTPTVPGATYSWTGPNGFTSSAQNPTATDAGTYFVTITVNGCTSAAGSTTLVVNPVPATPSASNGGPYCEGATIQLSTSTVSGATYSWTGPNGFTSSDQNPTRANATTADAGTYFVTVTVNGCTSAAGSTNVVVNATPATPTASNDGPVCQGGTANLSTPTVAGATYSWTGPNGFTSSAQNPTASDAGTYFVTVTVNGCTSAAGSTTLVVNPTPATPTASNGGPYCEGATIQLSTPTVSGATYSWTGPNGFTSSDQNPTRANATTADAGTYSVTITVNGCTSAAGTTNVVVNATPATPTASNGGPYCEGATIQLSTPTVSGATYAWTGPNGFTSSDQNPTRANATAADAGTYSVTITVNGCTSAAGTSNVVVNATPATPTASNGGPYCEGATIQLSTPTVSGATYAWTGPNGFTSSDQNPTRANATAADAGTYSVTITVNGCTSAAGTTNVVVNSCALSIDDVAQLEGNSGTTDFIFTVTKSGANAAAVDFQTQAGVTNPATAGASCGTAGVDYETQSGSLNFTSSETQKQITIKVCGDTTPELNETLFVKLLNPSGATIGDDTGLGTILNDDESVSAGQLIISEFRLSGPGANPTAQANNEFIELYNNTDNDLFVTTTDGSAGWAVAKSGGVEVFHIPNGVTIPARGHYLGTNTTGYSLKDYGGTDAALGDATWTTDVPDNTALAVFRTNNPGNFSLPGNRLDSVGPNTQPDGLYKEGTGYAPLSTPNLEHTFFRQICVFQADCPTPGRPRDTQLNAADFIYADTLGTPTSSGQRLGAPGPENLASPIKRDPAINLVILDATVSDAGAPNRNRNSTTDSANASLFGTMTIRRRVVNQTGGTVTRLRFRVIEMSTHPSGVFADLRLRSSSDQSITGVNDTNTCASTGTPSTPSCTVTVKGLTLEQPPLLAPANGGGMNTTVTLPLPAGLPDGQSVNVNFLLGVQKTGQFKFYLVIEALP